jgi:flagellum-specific peptidoglycan hydrolase FlgJ
MTQAEIDFLKNAEHEANLADHVFPSMAACEAALESRYGTSGLAADGNNLFGMKQHRHAEYGTLALPTREFQNGEWVVIDADFIKYPEMADCFRDRMATLLRLAPVYSNYHYALIAATPESYVQSVSKTWSTDPGRAAVCIQIYDEYLRLESVTENLGA